MFLLFFCVFEFFELQLLGIELTDRSNSTLLDAAML